MEFVRFLLHHQLCCYIYFSCCLADNETAVLRYNFGDPQLGTCTESQDGGNHFRYWTQNGSNADRCVI